MNWRLSHRADTRALPIADRHYNRQKVGSPQFVPPGRCLVLLTNDERSLWTSSFPMAEYTHHAWAGAWVNTLFRNEGPTLASDLIREAVAATRWVWGSPPPLGLITFIDTTKVRPKAVFGNCYRHAGFRLAVCPTHAEKRDDCAACHSRTKVNNLLALQLLAADMPEPVQPIGSQSSLSLEAA